MKRYILITTFTLISLLFSSSYAQEAEQIEESTQDKITTCDRELNLCLDQIKAIDLAEKTAEIVEIFKVKFKFFYKDYKALQKEGMSNEDLAKKTEEQLRLFYEKFRQIKEKCYGALAVISGSTEADAHVIDGKIVSLPREFIDAGFGFDDIHHYNDNEYRVSTPDGELGITDKNNSNLENLKSKQIIALPTTDGKASWATDTKFKAIYYRDGKYVIEYENGYQDIYEIQDSQLVGTFVTPTGSTTGTYPYVSPEHRIQESINRQAATVNPERDLGLASYEFNGETQKLTIRGINGEVLNGEGEQLNFPPGVEMRVHENGHHLIFRDTVRGIFFGSSFVGQKGGSIGIVSTEASKGIEGFNTKPTLYTKRTSFGNEGGGSLGGSDKIQSVIDNHLDTVRYRDYFSTEPKTLNINSKQYTVRGPDRMGQYQFLSGSGNSSLYVNPNSGAIDFGANWNNTARVIDGGGSLSEDYIIVEQGLYGQQGNETKRFKVIFEPNNGKHYRVEEVK